MAYLIFILITLALFAGFFALTKYEAERGMRFFAPSRARLDREVERVEFIVAHVDLGAFVYDEVRHFMSRVGHDIVHLSLIVVRAVERLLTRLVRYMRIRHAETAAPRESTRAFVKELSDFKDHLEATRPEIPQL